VVSPKWAKNRSSSAALLEDLWRSLARMNLLLYPGSTNYLVLSGSVFPLSIETLDA
jgi:hypothetical protein